MPTGRIRFHQTGSFAAGNRLLPADLRSIQSLPERSNALTCGHRACQGCGEALGARYALDAVLRATKGKVIAVNATGCLEVFSTPFPETSWQIAWLHSLFGNAPAVAAGVAAALEAAGRTDIRVVGQGGDGGTVDIGLACLSGMFERNDDVLYICYDNQAYMNTGVQRSGATPPAARTATTPATGPEPGNAFGQGKNAPLIAMAHEIPYVATATVADLRDLEYKAARAMDFHGARYLHILVPCPLGWGSSPADTIKVARLATESGLFPVFEAENGQVTGATPIRRQVPVTDYLRLQARYAHLFQPEERTDVIARIQASADRNIARFGLPEKRKNPSGPNPDGGTMNRPEHRLRVLVSAASRHESTTEIARVIRDTLAGNHLVVDIVPPDVVDSIDDYDAVLLGSAVYAGHWLASAADFAVRFAGPLAVRPVWLFSSGPVGALSSKKDPAEVTRIQQAIPVRGHQMFDGKLDPQALSVVERTSLLASRGVRGDFRDWDAVTQWAGSIAASLRAEALPLP